jgi:hypothetical protein
MDNQNHGYTYFRALGMLSRPVHKYTVFSCLFVLLLLIARPPPLSTCMRGLSWLSVSVMTSCLLELPGGTTSQAHPDPKCDTPLAWSCKGVRAGRTGICSACDVAHVWVSGSC